MAKNTGTSRKAREQGTLNLTAAELAEAYIKHFSKGKRAAEKALRYAGSRSAPSMA